MRIVFFNRCYWPDASATSQLLTDLAAHLAGLGHEIVVATGRHRLDVTAPPLPQRARVDGVDIHRLRTTALGRLGLAGRALDYASYYLAAFGFALRNLRRGDVVVAKTDPPLLGAVMQPAVWLKRAELVNWWQDVYPDVAERLGMLHFPLVGRLLRGLRNFSLRRARSNVAIGAGMAEHLRRFVAPERVALIHNWSAPMAADPLPQASNAYRSELGLGLAVVFAYSGNLGRAHRFDALLAAGARLRERTDLRFLIVGDGPQLPSLKSAARGWPNWTFLPLQPRERLAESLAAADVHLVSLDPGLEGLIVPSKLYGVLAAARPTLFIGAPDGEAATLLREHDCGVAVAADDVAGLEQAIERLAADRALRLRLGANAQAAAAQFSFETAARQWERVLTGQPVRSM